MVNDFEPILKYSEFAYKYINLTYLLFFASSSRRQPKKKNNLTTKIAELQKLQQKRTFNELLEEKK